MAPHRSALHVLVQQLWHLRSTELQRVLRKAADPAAGSPHRHSRYSPPPAAAASLVAPLHVASEAAVVPTTLLQQAVARFPSAASEASSQQLLYGRRRLCLALLQLLPHRALEPPAERAGQPFQHAFPHHIAGLSQGRSSYPGNVLQGGGWRLSSDWPSLLYRPALHPFILGLPDGAAPR